MNNFEDDDINSAGLPVVNENSKNNLVDVKASLDNVNERIAMAMYDVKAYSNLLESNNTPPSLEKKWYQLSVVKVKELNKTLNVFHDFVYRSFNLVKCVLDAQNENTKNICDLICLIAAGEAHLYGQLKDLTVIDQEDIEKLKILEKRFLESLELNKEDKETTHKQFERLIDYTQAVETVKNKWIRGLEVKINDVYNSIDHDIEKAITDLESTINCDRKKHEDSINAINKEVRLQIDNLKETKDGVNRQRLELQKLMDGIPDKMRELCDEHYKELQHTLSTFQSNLSKDLDSKIKTLSANQESFQSNLSKNLNSRFKLQDDKLARQDVEINKLKRKSFFDSKVYKIGIGIIAIAALVCSLVL